jgi:hypothetical protein
MTTAEEAGRTIFRYTVPVDGKPWTQWLTSDPVAVANGVTPDEAEFWAEFTAGAPKAPRRFQVFGTGHPLPLNARCICISAAWTPDGVCWHLYELVSNEKE